MSKYENENFIALFGSNSVSQIEKKVGSILAKKMAELGAKKHDQYLLSAPTESNGATAITRTSISLVDGRESSAVSAVCGKVRGIENNEDVVTLSLIRSNIEAIDLIENLPALSKDQQVIDVVPEKTEIRIGFDQNKYKHRFDKTLSDSQKKVIQDMSVKRGINISSLCQKMFNKELKELSSAQAHEIIQYLKDPNKR